MRVVWLLGLLAAVAADPCAIHPDCAECVADTPNVCGWCSENVVYKNGSTGVHCVSNNGATPFACYGIFSTESCQSGYVCNPATHTCETTNPGEGVPLDTCRRECGASPTPPAPSPTPPPPADTYECNHTDYKCYVSTPGHGGSLEVCEQGCHPATPAAPAPPTPPTPPPPPAQTYDCNQTAFSCYKAAAGHGSSLEVCMNECKPGDLTYECDFKTYTCFQTSNPNATSKEGCEQICVKLYTCDEGTHTCVEAPYPNPGLPLADCDTTCKPHNNTPTDLVGVWRGLQLNQGYKEGEWDIQFTDKEMILHGPVLGQKAVGNVAYYGTSARRLLEVSVTGSVIPGITGGDKLEILYDFDGASPENRFLMMASSGPNKKAPADWAEALAMTTGWDWTLMECQVQTSCKFNMMQRTAPQPVVKRPKAVQMKVLNSLVDDPCMPIATCSQCLASTFHCGWCSVPVVYKDGTPGKNCAGWGPNNTRNEFECHGTYRTDDCNDYECVHPQGTCEKVPLGGGMSLGDCKATCKPGTVAPTPPAPSPTPPPPADTYECNHTDYKCYKSAPGHGGSLEVCEQGCHPATPAAPAPPTPPTPPPPPASTYECNMTDMSCFKSAPGHGSSLEVCMKACSVPPVPPPVTGKWRGLQTDNQYVVGEFQLAITATGYTLTNNGTTVDQGTVVGNSKVGELMFTSTTTGTQRAAIYSEAKGITVTHMTIVMGKDASDVPTGWDVPWIGGGAAGSEWVFVDW